MSIVELRDVTVDFPSGRAMDQVSLEIAAGETFGLVGESGCGKSTTAKVLMGLVAPSRGAVVVDGWLSAGARTVRSQNRSRVRPPIQMVFQDPASSLNPRRRVGSVLGELITHHALATRAELPGVLADLMEMVGLPVQVLDSYPGDLSGGQRQRVAIARALAVRPKVLIADEAVSALDVSAQAKVINLFADLRDELGLTLIFISHDLGVVRALCDRIGVMNAGRLVEVAETERLFASPQEPFTRRLLSAIPDLRAYRGGGETRTASEPAPR